MTKLRHCKILLVDDTKTNIDVLVHALKDNYKLAVALDGNRAIDYAKNNRLDLILLDVVMPDLNGFEVCQILKDNPATCSVPIIFITSMNAARHKTRGFEIGAVDYITKPFDIAEVKARVKTHLALKVAQESLKKQNEILEEKVLERTKELTQAQIEIVKRLGLAAEYRDEETGQHIKRMSEFCLLLSQSAGLPKAICNRIALAATMHDVGKIGISDLILFKPGKLDENEFEEIKTHTTIGARLLSGGKSSLLKEAQSVAWTHHEKWDGTGYPRGLKGEKIPLAGRIACICDVFDALISKRPYKEAWPVPKAMEEIKAGSGRHFDPKLVELFVGLESELKKIVQDMGAQ